MEEHGLLTSASAIAFQVLTSLIPLALLVLSVMGFLHLDEVWTRGPRAAVRGAGLQGGLRGARRRGAAHAGPGAGLVADGRRGVHARGRCRACARAIMGVLSEVYGDGDDRPFGRRYAISFALGTGRRGLRAAARSRSCASVARRSGLDEPGWLVEAAVFVVRWGAALALLMHRGRGCCCASRPRIPGPHRWVSFGSGLCVVAWVGDLARVRRLRHRHRRTTARSSARSRPSSC